ncbi:porin family protein [Vibrio marisflavi]|uniref:Outer membrane protein A n=1 Tax=Vibrio marisflavi CECT 7928 TaxID=634439 RepID=A0ABN8E570_9VIBR|nr:porin family protein [Vibrio marisflavi]CAH0540728.1 Outer membrane protein A [Vibrio marisflavi CECT 7928]
MKKALIVLTLLSVSAAASADTRFYGGSQIGVANLGNDSSATYGFHIGTSVTPNIGVEAGYQFNGKFDDSGYDNTNKDIKVRARYLAVRPNVDIGPYNLYVRVGIDDYSVTGENGYKENHAAPMYGFGAEYHFNERFSLGLGYNLYDMREDDLHSVTINSSFHFG